MDKNAACLRVLIAKNEGGRVGYCENRDVVEMEIGAMSLRIDAKDLRYLTDLLKEVDVRLVYFRRVKEQEQSNSLVARGRIH